jgi:hypothetical protein
MRTAGDTGGLLGRSMPAACHNRHPGRLRPGPAGPAAGPATADADRPARDPEHGHHPGVVPAPAAAQRRQLYFVLIKPGLSHLSARQILNRLLGIT